MSLILPRRRLLLGASALVVGALILPRNAAAATVSNIHYNLTAWASGQSISIGQRRSNAGKAYQATTAGTTGATGPTNTSGTSSDGAVTWQFLSTIDYTTLQAWWNALPATFTVNVQANLWNNGPITTTQTVSWLDVTLSIKNNAGFSATITCAPGESIRDYFHTNPTAPRAINQSAGVCFVAPSSGTTTLPAYFYVSGVQNVILDGLQFVNPIDSGQPLVSLAAANTMQNCIIDGYSSTNNVFNVSDVNNKFINCLFIERNASSSTGYTFYASGGGAYFYNCAFVSVNGNAAGYALNCYYIGAANYVTMENCIVIGWTNPFIVNTYTVPTTYSLFSNSSLPTGASGGTGNVYSGTASGTFKVAYTDFGLKAGSSAINAAVTDTTNVPSSDDLARTTRPQGSAWDIGPFEYVAATQAGSAWAGIME